MTEGMWYTEHSVQYQLVHPADEFGWVIFMGGKPLIQLNFRDAKPIYEQVKDGIRHLVVTNAFAANDKLPSVRELASRLAINPNTIARAYQELEQEGYIYTVSGKGTFVSGSEDIQNHRTDELMESLDEIVQELAFLAVPKEELVERVEKAAAGGIHDSGK